MQTLVNSLPWLMVTHSILLIAPCFNVTTLNPFDLHVQSLGCRLLVHLQTSPTAQAAITCQAEPLLSGDHSLHRRPVSQQLSRICSGNSCLKSLNHLSSNRRERLLQVRNNPVITLVCQACKQWTSAGLVSSICNENKECKSSYKRSAHCTMRMSLGFYLATCHV